MKTKQILLSFLIYGFLLCHGNAYGAINYFDQTLPGDSAVIFSPDFISTDGLFVQNGCFSSDGTEFIFVITDDAWSFSKIMYTKYSEEDWSEPDTLSFTIPVNQNLVPCFSYDGQKIFFISRYRNDFNTADIWVSTRSGEDWEEPVRIDEPVSSNSDEWEVTIAENGTLYFSSNRGGGFGNMDVYKSECVDGNYSTVENLGVPINTSSADECPYIAPDESYMVFNSWKPNVNFGGNNLYVSYRKEDHTWTNPKDLGSTVNTDLLDIYPNVTPDGNYLLFTRRGELPGDDFSSSKLFWISTGILDSLRNTNFQPYAKYLIPDITIELGQEILYIVPDTTFYDDDENDTLILTASLSNNNELPDWLEFDENTSTFSGTPSEAGDYSIKVTATDNEGGTCNDIFQIRVQNPDAIENGTESTIQIYPNPAGNLIHIDSGKSTHLMEQYTIFDVSGIMIQRGTVSSDNSIDITSLHKGVYLIQFYDIKNTILCKLVVCEE